MGRGCWLVEAGVDLAVFDRGLHDGPDRATTDACHGVVHRPDLRVARGPLHRRDHDLGELAVLQRTHQRLELGNQVGPQITGRLPRFPWFLAINQHIGQQVFDGGPMPIHRRPPHTGLFGHPQVSDRMPALGEQQPRPGLDAVTNYVLNHGLAEFSLRPAAQALGVTHATLLRHFETKEQLIVTVVEGICADLVTEMTDRVGDLTAPTEHVLRVLWNHLCTPNERRQFLLLFELVAANAREPGRYGQLSTVLLDDLLAPLEENLVSNGHEPTHARALATNTLALIRGLQLDLAISGDREHVDQAMHHYIDMIIASHTLTADSGPAVS